MYNLSDQLPVYDVSYNAHPSPSQPSASGSLDIQARWNKNKMFRKNEPDLGLILRPKSCISMKPTKTYVKTFKLTENNTATSVLHQQHICNTHEKTAVQPLVNDQYHICTRQHSKENIRNINSGNNPDKSPYLIELQKCSKELQDLMEETVKDLKFQRHKYTSEQIENDTRYGMEKIKRKTNASNDLKRYRFNTSKIYKNHEPIIKKHTHECTINLEMTPCEEIDNHSTLFEIPQIECENSASLESRDVVSRNDLYPNSTYTIDRDTMAIKPRITIPRSPTHKTQPQSQPGHFGPKSTRGIHSKHDVPRIQCRPTQNEYTFRPIKHSYCRHTKMHHSVTFDKYKFPCENTSDTLADTQSPTDVLSQHTHFLNSGPVLRKNKSFLQGTVRKKKHLECIKNTTGSRCPNGRQLRNDGSVRTIPDCISGNEYAEKRFKNSRTITPCHKTLYPEKWAWCNNPSEKDPPHECVDYLESQLTSSPTRIRYRQSKRGSFSPITKRYPKADTGAVINVPKTFQLSTTAEKDQVVSKRSEKEMTCYYGPECTNKYKRLTFRNKRSFFDSPNAFSSTPCNVKNVSHKNDNSHVDYYSGALDDISDQHRSVEYNSYLHDSRYNFQHVNACKDLLDFDDQIANEKQFHTVKDCILSKSPTLINEFIPPMYYTGRDKHVNVGKRYIVHAPKSLNSSITSHNNMVLQNEGNKSIHDQPKSNIEQKHIESPPPIHLDGEHISYMKFIHDNYGPKHSKLQSIETPPPLRDDRHFVNEDDFRVFDQQIPGSGVTSKSPSPLSMTSLRTTLTQSSWDSTDSNNPKNLPSSARYIYSQNACEFKTDKETILIPYDHTDEEYVLSIESTEKKRSDKDSNILEYLSPNYQNILPECKNQSSTCLKQTQMKDTSNDMPNLYISNQNICFIEKDKDSIGNNKENCECDEVVYDNKHSEMSLVTKRGQTNLSQTILHEDNLKMCQRFTSEVVHSSTTQNHKQDNSSTNTSSSNKHISRGFNGFIDMHQTKKEHPKTCNSDLEDTNKSHCDPDDDIITLDTSCNPSKNNIPPTNDRTLGCIHHSCHDICFEDSPDSQGRITTQKCDYLENESIPPPTDKHIINPLQINHLDLKDSSMNKRHCLVNESEMHVTEEAPRLTPGEEIIIPQSTELSNNPNVSHGYNRPTLIQEQSTVGSNSLKTQSSTKTKPRTISRIPVPKNRQISTEKLELNIIINVSPQVSKKTATQIIYSKIPVRLVKEKISTCTHIVGTFSSASVVCEPNRHPINFSTGQVVLGTGTCVADLAKPFVDNQTNVICGSQNRCKNERQNISTRYGGKKQDSAAGAQVGSGGVVNMFKRVSRNMILRKGNRGNCSGINTRQVTELLKDGKPAAWKSATYNKRFNSECRVLRTTQNCKHQSKHLPVTSRLRSDISENIHIEDNRNIHVQKPCDDTRNKGMDKSLDNTLYHPKKCLSRIPIRKPIRNLFTT